MPFRCLFHVHTYHSLDSLLSPRTILAKARRQAVYALIVSDHNTIQGSLEVQKLAHGDPPLVITAAEYQSEKGDIIGLFLKEEIRSRRSQEIIQQIHAQDGLVVLPHPYKAHVLDDGLLEGTDLVETYNARCSENENEQARLLAEKWSLPSLAGADAHCSAELNCTINEFLTDPPTTTAQLRRHLMKAPRSMAVQRPSVLCRPYSQMIKAVKTRDPILFLYQLKRLALVLAQR